MSTIELSPACISSITSRMFVTATLEEYPHLAGLTGNGAGWGGARPAVSIRLMQGTPPPLPNSTTAASRSTDTLVEWWGTDFPGNVTSNINPVVVNSPYRAAIRTGTATWLWWIVSPSSGLNNTTGTFLHEIIGTVGGLGSGADLELAYPNIITGVNYKLQNLRVQFPTSWTY